MRAGQFEIARASMECEKCANLSAIPDRPSNTFRHIGLSKWVCDCLSQCLGGKLTIIPGFAECLAYSPATFKSASFQHDCVFLWQFLPLVADGTAISERTSVLNISAPLAVKVPANRFR